MAKASETRRAFVEDGRIKTHIGGQALIEGVMMRGRYNWALGVREPSGRLYAEEHELSKKGNRPSWLSWPLVRGCVALVDSLVLGFKALEIAANHALVEEDETACPATEINNNEAVQDTPEPQTDKATSAESDEFGHGEMAFAMVFGIVLGVALFIFLPAFLSNVLVGEYEENSLVWNLVDGIARVAIFVFYVWLIGRMKDIHRMFSYHGAEHKTIHCFEHGMPLTPENARQFPRLHVRCGTAFLIMVMIIAIVVYTLVPLDGVLSAAGISGAQAFALLLVVRIAFVPLIAGISYEITVKWAGNHPENPLVRIVLWPGMQMQRLTTNEPDDSMLECAIAAMELVLAREKSEERQ